MKKSVKNFLNIFTFLTFFIAFFSSEIFAQSIRFTSFDDRPICESSKGIWREFGNGCTDECYAKLDQFSVCSDAITYGCDCGKGRCWDGNQCVILRNYKKLFDQEQEKDAKVLSEAKKKRKDEAKANEQAMMEKFVSQISSGAPSDGDSANPNQQPGITNVGSPVGAISSGNNLSQFYKNALPSEPNQNQQQAQQPAIQQPIVIPTIPDQPQIQQSQLLPPVDTNAQKPNSTVPPLFLQQEQAKEQAKQAAAAAANPAQPANGIAVPSTLLPSKNSQPPKPPAIDPLTGSVPPGLPEIPLP
jgi:hypothetical protein